MIDRVLELSKALIAYKTVTPINDGCIEFVADFLEKLGFQIYWLNQGEVKNLYAEYGKENKQATHICFAGHTDVVPAGEQWRQDPFKPQVIDGRLYGRGTADMKCAVACWLALLSDMDLSGKRLSVLLTTDEEGEAIHGLRTVTDFLKQRDISFFLLGEPTAREMVGDCLKIGRRGSVTAELVCYGKQGHIAYPDYAINPLDLLDNVFRKLDERLLDKSVYAFGPSKIVRTSIDTGNQAENVIPGMAKMRFGIRFNTSYTVHTIKQMIEEICKEELGAYDLKVWLHGNAFIVDNVKILDWLKLVTPEAIFDAKGATSDGRFLTEVAPVIECGCLEKQAHQVDENVSLDDLDKLYRLYERFIGFLDKLSLY